MISEMHARFRRHFCAHCRVQVSLHNHGLRTKDQTFTPCRDCEKVIERIVAGEVVPEQTL